MKQACLPAEVSHARTLFAQGNFEAVKALTFSMLEEEPGNTEARFLLAQTLCEIGEFAPSERLARELLSLDAQNASYLAVLGLALHKQGKLQEGMGCYDLALNLEPENPLTLRNLGIFWLDRANYRLAIAKLSASTERDSGDAKAHNCLGLALRAQNRLEEAIRSFTKAIMLRPGYENAHHNLISAYERNNRLGEARSSLVQARRALPTSRAFDIVEAVILRREGHHSEAIKLLENSSFPPGSLLDAKRRHELAILYDRTMQTNRAFQEFENFNSSAAQAYRIDESSKSPFLAGIHKCYETVSPRWVASWTPDPSPPSADKSPSFLIGFPRSGTTLLQTVLDKHSEIYAADEVQAMHLLARQWKAAGEEYPGLLQRMNSSAVSRSRDFYFQIHRGDQKWRQTSVFVDKNPFMIQHVVGLHRMFPFSKYVFALRHPCDCVLSSYMQMFEPNDATVWLYDLDDIVTIYCAIMDLWERYTSSLPIKVHYVRYEDVITDFRGTVSRLLDFLNLKWEDQLQEFYRSTGGASAVRTASYAQVNRPVYSDAALRWQRYASHLEPYLDRLAPYIERFRYTTDKTQG